LAYPDLIIEADYTTPPLIIPTDWVDLSSRATETASIRQGRQRLLGRTETGSASAELTNADRGLDPTVHPEVKPGVHFRMRAFRAGATYDLFRGFARSWGQIWPQHVLAHVQVEAEDAFALMARYDLEGDSIAEMSSGEHLRTVLTLYGWPPSGSIPPGKTWWRLGTVGASELGTTTFLGESLNRIDDGLSTIMALDLNGNLLDHLLNVAERTEGGTLYMGPGGDVVFRERPSPFAPSIAIFGDVPGELRYVDLPLDYDDVELYNDVRVTRRGDSTPSVAKDDVAIAAGDPPRTLPLGDVLFSTMAQADSAAAQLLARYRQPVLHPRRMVLRPGPNSPLWSVILGRELGDKITVRRRPPGGGAPIELDCLILGITYDVKPEQWEVTWDLAPAEQILEGYWYLGRAGRSELGTTTVLA
jgi:hypothetical protein